MLSMFMLGLRQISPVGLLIPVRITPQRRLSFIHPAAASPPSLTTTFAFPLLVLLGRVLTNKLQKVGPDPLRGWLLLIPFFSSSKYITVKKKSNHAFVILLGFASIIKISGGFTEIYVSNFMYLSCLKNLRVNLLGLFLSPSPFSSEEKTLPPFPLPLERDDSSASLPSVCFSFFIGLLSCGAVSTGPEDATEITSVFLVDEVWTSTSHYVTIP